MNVGKEADFLQIVNEPAINSEKFFRWIDKELDSQKNLKIIDEYVSNINILDKESEIFFNNEKLISNKILICSGSFSNTILKGLNLNLLPIFFGVGTALTIVVFWDNMYEGREEEVEEIEDSRRRILV